MDADFRRGRVMEELRRRQTPLSASNLAKMLGVSRQVIVGDVALLRSQGHDIVATARGYVIPMMAETGRYIGKIACQHSLDDTLGELYTVADMGAVVLDVIVEHELYGEITGQLNIANREDADAFFEKVISSGDRLLSELTMGVHLHTLACRDRAHFERICQALGRKGFLVEEN